MTVQVTPQLAVAGQRRETEDWSRVFVACHELGSIAVPMGWCDAQALEARCGRMHFIQPSYASH